MKQPGRAFALFKPKEQGPQISQRINEFSSKLPELELRQRIASSLDEDIHLRIFARTASEAGMCVAIIAEESGVPSFVVAGELRLILKLMNDLVDGKPSIIYKERGEYKLI